MIDNCEHLAEAAAGGPRSDCKLPASEHPRHQSPAARPSRGAELPRPPPGHRRGVELFLDRAADEAEREVVAALAPSSTASRSRSSSPPPAPRRCQRQRSSARCAVRPVSCARATRPCPIASAASSACWTGVSTCWRPPPNRARSAERVRRRVRRRRSGGGCRGGTVVGPSRRAGLGPDRRVARPAGRDRGREPLPPARHGARPRPCARRRRRPRRRDKAAEPVLLERVGPPRDPAFLDRRDGARARQRPRLRRSSGRRGLGPGARLVRRALPRRRDTYRDGIAEVRRFLDARQSRGRSGSRC